MLRLTIAITSIILCLVHVSVCQSDIGQDVPVQPYPSKYPPTTSPPKPPTCSQKSLSEVSNKVTCKLLNQITTKTFPRGGFAVSVFNILHVLLMIANAAGGNTRYQLANRYLEVCDLNKINREFQAYLGQLKENRTSDGKQKTLVIPAAGVFVENNYPVKADYKQRMKDYYGAPAANEPFSSDPRKALNDINEYIRELTQDYYKKFFPAPFDTNTIVVEVSTFYLLSSWLGSDYFKFSAAKQYFSPSCTDKPIYAQYMSNDRGLSPAGYAVITEGSNKWEAVRIPLYTEKYSVILLQPQNRCQEAVPYLKNLTPEKITQLFKALANYRTGCQVWFDMPQFKVNSTFDNVVNHLKAGGVIDLFENANLTNGIAQRGQGGKMEVSTIAHRCDVSMNRTGILAVAATGAGITTTAIQECEQSPKRVRFDHPFVFFIVENKEQAIIFSGSVNTPNFPLVAEDS